MALNDRFQFTGWQSEKVGNPFHRVEPSHRKYQALGPDPV